MGSGTNIEGLKAELADMRVRAEKAEAERDEARDDIVALRASYGDDAAERDRCVERALAERDEALRRRHGPYESDFDLRNWRVIAVWERRDRDRFGDVIGNAKTREDAASFADALNGLASERDQLRAEVERLRCDVATMKALLRDAIGCDLSDPDDDLNARIAGAVGWGRAFPIVNNEEER